MSCGAAGPGAGLADSACARMGDSAGGLDDQLSRPQENGEVRKATTGPVIVLTGVGIGLHGVVTWLSWTSHVGIAGTAATADSAELFFFVEVPAQTTTWLFFSGNSLSA